MLKKTITYKNPFTGDPVSEDHYFNLSKSEIIGLEVSHKGGLYESLQRIVNAEDANGLFQEIKLILMTSYGQRSADGRLFIKNEEVRQEFEATGAYDALFTELVTDASKAAEFVTGIMPADMDELVAKFEEQAKRVQEEQNQKSSIPQTPPGPPPIQIVRPPLEEGVEKPAPIVLTKTDIDLMSSDEVKNLGQRIISGEVVLGTDNN